jgi:transposase
MQAFEKRELARKAAAVVGVDAGKFQHVMVIRPRGGADSKPIAFATTRAGFEQAVAAIYEAASGIDGHILVGIEFAGMYGFTFAHYLHNREFHIHVVSVLASHTKRWKEVTHRQPLKTDAKDAVGIADLTAQGHFVAFPFLSPAYAELRYLLSAREKLSTLRKATITRLRASLDVIFPEFPSFFASPVAKTARALLRAYPGPAALCKARQRDVKHH